MFIITILMMVSNIYIYIRVNYKIYFRVFLVEQNGNHTLLYYWRANLTHTLQTEDRHQSFAPPMSITLKRRARWPMIDLVSKSATMSSVLQWYTSICPLAMYSCTVKSRLSMNLLRPWRLPMSEVAALIAVTLSCAILIGSDFFLIFNSSATSRTHSICLNTSCRAMSSASIELWANGALLYWFTSYGCAYVVYEDGISRMAFSVWMRGEGCISESNDLKITFLREANTILSRLSYTC